MKKLLIVGAILFAVGAFVVAKNAKMRSYCGAAWHTCQNQIQNEISPEFEIERLKLEIARLDKEVPSLVNALAVMDQDRIRPLKAQVAKAQQNLKAREQTLLEFAKAVKGNTNSQFVFAKETFSPARANDKLTQDYALYQSLKVHVESQEKLLAAREQQYRIKHDQVVKIRQTQEAFQLKLTQLETDLALLRASEANGDVTDANFDNSHITLIQDGLKDLQRKVDIMKKAKAISDEISPPTAGGESTAAPKLDPDVVLNAIQGQPADKSSVQTTSPQN